MNRQMLAHFLIGFTGKFPFVITLIHLNVNFQICLLFVPVYLKSYFFEYVFSLIQII